MNYMNDLKNTYYKDTLSSCKSQSQGGLICCYVVMLQITHGSAFCLPVP